MEVREKLANRAGVAVMVEPRSVAQGVWMFARTVAAGGGEAFKAAAVQIQVNKRHPCRRKKHKGRQKQSSMPFATPAMNHPTCSPEGHTVPINTQYTWKKRRNLKFAP